MTSRRLHLAATLSFAAVSALAIAQSKHAAFDPLNATWAKVYATDCGSAIKHPCPSSTNGYENEFNGDPRLPELLHRELPQRESWWVNGRAGSAPVSAIVQEFIGVPRDVLLDDDRFVTATGCVPHDCGDGGMLWIDTGSHPAILIFVAHDSIQSLKGGAGTHLWVYASAPMNFEVLPPDFLANLARWHNGLVASSAKLPRPIQPIFSQQVALATLVQPNGRMHDLTYEMLFYKQDASQFHPTGAKQ